MSTRETQPGAPRDLPDFLKSGDPALTWPHGKTYGVNHPKGVPRDPCATDPQSADRELLDTHVTFAHESDQKLTFASTPNVRGALKLP